MSGEVMSANTWRAYCQAIVTMAGPPMEPLKPDRPQVEFKCDRCSMEFKTAMKLDGIAHMAIQNKCGGIWRIK